MKNNVIDLNARKRDREVSSEDHLARHREEVLNAYLEDVGKDLSEIMTAEDIARTVQMYLDEDKELVFRSQVEASAYSTALIQLPMFDHISHFEVVPCISRLSIFYKFNPVPKSETQYVFPTEDMTYGISLININHMEDPEQ